MASSTILSEINRVCLCILAKRKCFFQTIEWMKMNVDIFWSEDVNNLQDSVDWSKNGADRNKTYWMMQPWRISYQTLLPLPLGADTFSERFSKGDQEIRESVKCHRSPPGDDFNSVEIMFDRFKLESWIPKLMCQIKKYFTSSDPHHGISRQILWHIFWHIFWHFT